MGKSKLQGYVGTALGIYFNWLQRENAISGQSNSSVAQADFGLGVPVGGTFSIGESVFINANYTLNWLWENDLFENNLLHAFNVGVGFKL